MWNHGRTGQSEVNGPAEVLLEWVRKHNRAFHQENSQVQVVEIQSREALLIIWRSQLPRQHCALARCCSIVKHLLFVYPCFDQSQIKKTHFCPYQRVHMVFLLRSTTYMRDRRVTWRISPLYFQSSKDFLRQSMSNKQQWWHANKLDGNFR